MERERREDNTHNTWDEGLKIFRIREAEKEEGKESASFRLFIKTKVEARR